MRIALGLEYDGSPFHGWQSQADGSGVQDALERALSKIAGTPVRAVAAGRTDAGAHTAGNQQPGHQWTNFEDERKRLYCRDHGRSAESDQSTARMESHDSPKREAGSNHEG